MCLAGQRIPWQLWCLWVTSSSLCRVQKPQPRREAFWRPEEMVRKRIRVIPRQSFTAACVHTLHTHTALSQTHFAHLYTLHMNSTLVLGENSLGASSPRLLPARSFTVIFLPYLLSLSSILTKIDGHPSSPAQTAVSHLGFTAPSSFCASLELWMSS